jgi:hypothetical protein
MVHRVEASFFKNLLISSEVFCGNFFAILGTWEEQKIIIYSFEVKIVFLIRSKIFSICFEKAKD